MADAVAVYRAKPTQDEIADVLGQRTVAALGTLNVDGSIHLTYVIFLVADGRLYLETSSVTRKARNATARPQASFLVHGTASSGRSVMVSGEGAARVIEGDEAAAINRRIRAKYLSSDALDAVDRAWASLDDVAIEISPARWRSWTGDELRRETERETGRPYDEIWQD